LAIDLGKFNSDPRRYDPATRTAAIRTAKTTPTGKPRRRAIGARTPELLMSAYGMLKNRTPLDSNWPSRIAT
jgi:hypothetical protein